MKKSIPLFNPITLVAFAVVLVGQLLPVAVQAQAIVQTGKSYVNISKGTNGGTIEPGDTLEIRATIAISRNGTYRNITRVHYVDTIPLNTIYIPGSLRILTNEGLVFRSYTDAGGDDQAMYNPVDRTLRINLGSSGNGNMGLAINSTAPGGTTGGTIHHQGRPSFFNSSCIMSASFRIRIDPSLPYGTLINLYGGAFRYRNVSDLVDPCNAYTIALMPNLGLCANAIGANAILENGGTFGEDNTQNRIASAIVPGYTRTDVTANTPNDGSYAIVNNLSPSGTTNMATPKPDYAAPQDRVFNLWDIMGDHTGAADPAAGNPPVAPGTTGGYFVAINASYANSNAIQQTVGGLCPNTYYEFSAWFKNICQYCACDSTGDGPYRSVGGVASPNPNFNGPDSSGVNPNLTFTIDGVDYYTTGNLAYTGQWVKKGFVYLTGPGQTSFTVTIRNNAAGGGGNDWAIDDVTLATCTPNLNMLPSPVAPVCIGNQVDISALIRCYFPNYTHWRWERSVDGGNTWMNTGVSGTGTPVLNSGEYEYTAGYPSFLGDSSAHGNIYRIRLASSPANLDNEECSFVNSTIIQIWVNDCSEVLHGDIQAFSGKVSHYKATLFWTLAGEFSPGTKFIVESSQDEIHFEKAGEVLYEEDKTAYSFTDPVTLAGGRYYRLRITNAEINKYTKAIQLSTQAPPEYAVRSLINPFSNKISFELLSPHDGPAIITLHDAYGRIVKTAKEQVRAGINSIQIHELGHLQSGLYVLQLHLKGKTIAERMIKTDN